jgi:hypothetical protein
MKLLDIVIDEKLLRDNKQTLADINKSLLFEQDQHIYEEVDFDNDEFFLDPSLFCYLLDKAPNKRLTLQQVCLGNRLAADQRIDLPIFFDEGGIAHLPGLGEFFAPELRGRIVSASMIPKERRLLVPHGMLEPLPGCLSFNTKWSFPVYLPEMLSREDKAPLRELPMQTLAGARGQLEEALDFLSSHTAGFYSLLELVTREVTVFNSPDQNSFAAITSHGAAFLNTENKQQDALFFIDDLSHQCGHIIFNTLTLQTEEYLTLPKTTPLAELLTVPGHSNRTLYGAFHGLFTYSCILHCLSAYFNHKNPSLSPEKKMVVLGRLGFYLVKFMVDLDSFYKIQQVFTTKGLELFWQFINSYRSVHAMFGQYTDRYSYANQPYTFDESLFLELNALVNDYQ